MGQAKDEIAGKAKRVAGAVTGDDDLRAEGQAQDQKAMEEDHDDLAGQIGTLTDSDGERAYAWKNNRSHPDDDGHPHRR